MLPYIQSDYTLHIQCLQNKTIHLNIKCVASLRFIFQSFCCTRHYIKFRSTVIYPTISFYHLSLFLSMFIKRIYLYLDTSYITHLNFNFKSKDRTQHHYMPILVCDKQSLRMRYQLLAINVYISMLDITYNTNSKMLNKNCIFRACNI